MKRMKMNDSWTIMNENGKWTFAKNYDDNDRSIIKILYFFKWFKVKNFIYKKSNLLKLIKILIE